MVIVGNSRLFLSELRRQFPGAAAIPYDRLDLTQIDLRLGKVLRFGRTRSVVGVDLYNILNSATISGASPAYATWLAPSAIVAPRLTKVSLTVDF